MWRFAIIWLALSWSVSAAAQSIEPRSSADYKGAIEATERSDLSKAFQLFDRSCTRGDAAGCDFLAKLDSGSFMLYGREGPATTRPDYAAKAARLYGQRCSGTAPDAENCEDYAYFLRELRAWNDQRVSDRITNADALALEGGRAMAAQCRAASSPGNYCSMALDLLSGGTHAERAALQSVIDRKHQKSCEGGDAAQCLVAFRNATPQGLSGLRQSADRGCTAGWGNICYLLGQVLISGPSPDLAAGADALGRACKLPPKADQRDNRKTACDVEKKVRQALQTAKP